jgi:hypothetical protein
MKLSSVFLAVSILAKIREWGGSKSGSIQMWAFIGVLTLIALGAFFWAINFRKRRRHHQHHHHHSHREPPQHEESEKSKGGWFSSRRRRRRKKKRRANPTLAEIGGLPEARDPNEPPNI